MRSALTPQWATPYDSRCTKRCDGVLLWTRRDYCWVGETSRSPSRLQLHRTGFWKVSFGPYVYATLDNPNICAWTFPEYLILHHKERPQKCSSRASSIIPVYSSQNCSRRIIIFAVKQYLHTSTVLPQITPRHVFGVATFVTRSLHSFCYRSLRPQLLSSAWSSYEKLWTTVSTKLITAQ